MKTASDTKTGGVTSAKERAGVAQKPRQRRERVSKPSFGVVAFEIVDLDGSSSLDMVSLDELVSEGSVADLERSRRKPVLRSKKRLVGSVARKRAMRLPDLESTVLTGPVVLKGLPGYDGKGLPVRGKVLGITIPLSFPNSKIADLLAHITQTTRDFVEPPVAKRTAQVERVKGKHGVVTGLASPAQIKEMVLAAGGLLKSSEIADLRGLRTSNPSSMTQKWKDAGKVIALPYGGYNLYPDYLFDVKDDYKPRPVIKKIREALSEKMGPWQMGFWFICANNFLGGKTPREVIEKDPVLVLKAAQDEILGSLHG